MRKKTAPQIQKNREASSRKASGLIAQDLSAQQSATLDCVLDNRSHRTRFRLTSLTCNSPACTSHNIPLVASAKASNSPP